MCGGCVGRSVQVVYSQAESRSALGTDPETAGVTAVDVLPVVVTAVVPASVPAVVTVAPAAPVRLSREGVEGASGEDDAAAPVAAPSDASRAAVAGPECAFCTHTGGTPPTACCAGAAGVAVCGHPCCAATRAAVVHKSPSLADARVSAHPCLPLIPPPSTPPLASGQYAAGPCALGPGHTD